MVPYPWGIRNKTTFALLGNHEKMQMLSSLVWIILIWHLASPSPNVPFHHFCRVIGKWNLQMAWRSWQHFYLELSCDKLIFWLNVESKCVLVFQALFHVQDGRGKGCSALIKWAENFCNPSITYNSLNKNEETHSFLKGFFQK